MRLFNNRSERAEVIECVLTQLYPTDYVLMERYSNALIAGGIVIGAVVTSGVATVIHFIGKAKGEKNDSDSV